MDLDQTQAISDYEEEEEEEKVEKDKASNKKKEVAQLKVFSQQGFKEAIFPVFQGDNVLGRDGKCNITVPIKALSKKHACIEVQRDLHLIYDCGSKNRTKRGKSFLKPTIRYELKHGDMLTLGDVKCQYLVGLDLEEEAEDETGSETGSESMLQDVNTEEESDADKPVVTEGTGTSKKMDENGSIPRNALVQPMDDRQIANTTKDDEEAYAADTDSDTDEERPIAVAAVPTVLYSSEDEQETPIRPQVSTVPSKVNSSMEGQTLAFGLGSPANVFQSRDSTGSSGSHQGQSASVEPPTLKLSTESDSQSDEKMDVSSDNDYKPGSFKCPEPRSSETQPRCEPTLLYGSESDGESPIKRPKHPGARIKGKGPSCEPTLLYGSESDDGSPIKRPKHPETGVLEKGPSCEPTLLYDSGSEDKTPQKKPKQPAASNEPTLLYDSNAGVCTSTDIAPIKPGVRGDNHHASNEQTLLYGDVSEEKPPSRSDKSPGNVAENGTDRPDIVAIQDGDATLPYADVEMSSTDDEEESGADVNDKDINLEETPTPAEPTLAYNAEETKTGDSTDDENAHLDAEDYGADIATQAYAVDNDESESETESEPIPLRGGHTEAEKSDAKQEADPSDLLATQAYCLEDEDSNSSDSQPLPIGTAAIATHDDISATMAYGLEATQAYNVSEKDGDSSEDEGEQDKKQMPAYDLQATQAYGAGDDDDDDDDDDKRDSHTETVKKQSVNMDTVVNKVDTGQPTVPYGLEATQAYGADEETDDEDADNENDRSSTGGYQGRGDANAATLAYGLAPTQPYGGGDDNNDSDDDGDDKADKVSDNVRKDNLATLPYGLEETQAYDGDNNDTDSAQNSMIEATQAYGIESEPSETELQAKQSKRGTKQNEVRRVGFASTSTEVPEVDETEVHALETGKGGKRRPSTSAAADMDDYLPDSEDLISQPQSRFKRGRKKPVIRKSQEETSQQSDKLGEAGNQSESVVASSSVGATEQTEVENDTPEGILKRSAKTAARKGRRGAMRVTIEPEEPEEEETSENATRGERKGVAMVADETENQEIDIHKGTSAVGRKRGRQTTKTTSVSEEENKETPATKLRRGRKGSRLQAETMSVSETPIKTPSDTAKLQDVTDSEPATAVVVEPLSVRRGGRGRGRKGVAAKETMQTLEDQGEEASGASVEPQPESHVEAVLTRGKGKGKGRGKKRQSSNNESLATESVDAEVSAISEEVQPQQAIATPARGRGRGKGRGKKAQPTSSPDQELGASSRSSSPFSVPETPAINDEELPPPESPVLAATSKGKGRGRQGRGKKTQHSVAELEAEEGASRLESENSQTRKGRSRGKITMESTDQNSDIAVTLSESTEFSETVEDSEESSTAGSSKGSHRGRQRKETVEESESVEVEETPAKKSRRGKEPAVVRSPSLNRGKLPGEGKPRIMFTGLVDKQGEKVVTNLGGQLVDNIHNCTHLVTDKVRRTVKFLCGLASGQVIVLPSWLDACKKAKSFVDPSPFFVKDKDAEKQYKFTLQRSHEVALTKGLLEGYKIHVTKKVKPEPSQMKDIIQSAKGEFLSSMPRSKDDSIFVISCDEDKSVCKKPLEAGIPVVSAEVLLTGVLQQELNLDEHKLFSDEIGSASQDTASSGGQSKRRRETEIGASSSSTAETKSTGSKRRKR